MEAVERHGEVKPEAVKLTGDGIRGSGGLPWGRRKGAPQKGKWIEEGPRRLTGASVGGLGQPLGRGTGGKGRRWRPLFSSKPRKKNCGWTFLQLQKRSGTGVKNKFSH